MAAKIRGKLGFAAPLGYGRTGRWMLRPIARRQYENGCCNMGNDLVLGLKCWLSFLTNVPPKDCFVRGEVAIPMHTDAMGLGHIGVKWRANNTDYITHCHIPKWFTATKYINKNKKPRMLA